MLQRIQKIMANSGIASRRKCEELIKEGRVTVNGVVAVLGQSADDKDNIRIDGDPLSKERKRYIMLFKPANYISSVSDPQEARLVAQLVNVPERVFPVGRLDKDAEGLMLMTNDGEFANRLIHPRYEVPRTYFVRLARSLTRQDCEALSKGIKLRYFKTRPVKIKLLTAKRDVVEISLHEGKHKIVKLIFKALNNHVLYLRRDAIGSLRLRGIKVGKWRDLTKDELDKLKAAQNGSSRMH